MMATVGTVKSRLCFQKFSGLIYDIYTKIARCSGPMSATLATESFAFQLRFGEGEPAFDAPLAVCRQRKSTAAPPSPHQLQGLACGIHRCPNECHHQLKCSLQDAADALRWRWQVGRRRSRDSLRFADHRGSRPRYHRCPCRRHAARRLDP